MQADASEHTAREAVARIYHAFETHDVALLREAVTPDWEYLPEPPGQQPGPDQMIPIFSDLATALPTCISRFSICWCRAIASAFGQR